MVNKRQHDGNIHRPACNQMDRVHVSGVFQLLHRFQHTCPLIFFDIGIMFSTRDTVDTDTPASLAISLILATIHLPLSIHLLHF